MPFVRAGAITVHYDLAAPRDAPVVMLANSLGCNLHLWDDQVNALVRKHRVLRYDMRGHGLTDTTPDDDPAAGSIATLAGDAVELLDALGIHRVSFVGLSIGGMVAQRIGARHPERIDALVICATGNQVGPPSVWDARIATVEREGVEAIVEPTMQRWFTAHAHEARPELVQGFRNMVARTPKSGYLAGCRAVRDADLRADDALIRARTLILEGAHDPTATPEIGAVLQQAIAGSQLRVLSSAAHIMNAEQPVAFNEALLAFLEAV
jgi:3-oxoadipate enol-lactonase